MLGLAFPDVLAPGLLAILRLCDLPFGRLAPPLCLFVPVFGFVVCRRLQTADFPQQAVLRRCCSTTAICDAVSDGQDLRQYDPMLPEEVPD
jgi:hypothetical protein